MLDKRMTSVLNARIFEYIGTKRKGEGAVYLSTKSDDPPVIVYNFANDDKPQIGWRGMVLFKILFSFKPKDTTVGNSINNFS